MRLIRIIQTFFDLAVYGVPIKTSLELSIIINARIRELEKNKKALENGQ